MEQIKNIKGELKIINDYNFTIIEPTIKTNNTITELKVTDDALKNPLVDLLESELTIPNDTDSLLESKKKASFKITGNIDISELVARSDISITVDTPNKLKPSNNRFLLNHGFNPFDKKRSVKNAKISLIEDNNLIAESYDVWLSDIIPRIKASEDFISVMEYNPEDSDTILTTIEKELGIVKAQLTLETNTEPIKNKMDSISVPTKSAKNEINTKLKIPNLKIKEGGGYVGKSLDGLFNDILGIFGFDKNGKWSLSTFLKTGYIKVKRNSDGTGATLALGNDIPDFPIVLDAQGFKHEYGLKFFKQDFDSIKQTFPKIEKQELDIQQEYLLSISTPKLKADKYVAPTKSTKPPLKIANEILDPIIPEIRTVQGKIKTYYNVDDFLDSLVYSVANIQGSLLGIKESWSAKPIKEPINTRRAKYRSKAIQYMLERGPDFMSNTFDIALVETSVDMTRKPIHYIHPDDSYTMTTRSIAVRTASIEIPMPKTKAYETKFLTHTISRPGSSIDWKFQSALVVDLDEPLFMLDMVNDAIGQGVVRTGFGTNLGELLPETRRKNYVNSSIAVSPRIDLLISHIALMRDYDTSITKLFQKPAELQWKLTPDQLPFWVFEDIKFLGNEGDIKFDRESANTNTMNIPFIYRRLYLIDMTMETRNSYYTYGEGENTRGSWDSPSLKTYETIVDPYATRGTDYTRTDDYKRAAG